MQNKSKRRSKILVVAVVLATMVTTLAVFTDRAQSKDEYTAGTLDIQLTQNWATDNAQAAANYIPGDILTLNYTLKNAGNLDGKVRETFVLTTDKVITNEFEIYAAGDVDNTGADGYYAPKEGKNPIQVRSAVNTSNGTKITYAIPERKILAGGSDTVNLVLLFNKSSANSIRGTKIKIEYLAQMIQADNTGVLGDNTVWEHAAVKTETFEIGGETINVVPKLNDN